ncbi:hypothetical protein K438DRAFT_1849143, partial [Mycena galopus ATCC 62051]
MLCGTFLVFSLALTPPSSFETLSTARPAPVPALAATPRTRPSTVGALVCRRRGRKPALAPSPSSP